MMYPALYILLAVTTLTVAVLVCSAAFVFLWSEGLRQVQFQRPRGILFAEALILGGLFAPFASALFRTFPRAAIGPVTVLFSTSAILFGGAVLFQIVPPFIKKGS